MPTPPAARSVVHRLVAAALLGGLARLLVLHAPSLADGLALRLDEAIVLFVMLALGGQYGAITSLVATMGTPEPAYSALWALEPLLAGLAVRRGVAPVGAVAGFWLLVGLGGIYALADLPIDAVPDVTNVQVQVLTNAPALGPLDIERRITAPVEASMSGLPGVEEIRSVSRFGLSAVTVVFEEGTDLMLTRQLVGERLVDARESISDGSPEMGPISSGLGEILQFEVKSDRMCLLDKDGIAIDKEDCHTEMELRSELDWFVGNELRKVPGVVEVNSFGGELKTYEAEVLPERMRALGVSMEQVFTALAILAGAARARFRASMKWVRCWSRRATTAYRCAYATSRACTSRRCCGRAP